MTFADYTDSATSRLFVLCKIDDATFVLDVFQDPYCVRKDSVTVPLRRESLITDIAAASSPSRAAGVVFIADGGSNAVLRFDPQARRFVEPGIDLNGSSPVSLSANFARLLVTSETALFLYSASSAECDCLKRIRLKLSANQSAANHAVETSSGNFVVAIGAKALDSTPLNEVCLYDDGGSVLRRFGEFERNELSETRPFQPRYLSLLLGGGDENAKRVLVVDSHFRLAVLDEEFKYRKSIELGYTCGVAGGWSGRAPVVRIFIRRGTGSRILLYAALISGDILLFQAR